MDNNNDAENHIGEILKTAREAKNVSLADVSSELKIQANYLEAIENLEISNLPSIGYVLGYVRAYSRYLGMDENDAVTAYKFDSQVPENLGMRDQPHFVPKRQIRLPRGFFAAMTAMSCAAVLAFWYGSQTDAQSAAMSTRTVIDVTDVSLPAAPAIDPDVITIKATAPSWVQVKGKDGKVIISRILVTGETWQTEKSAGVTLSARDSGAIEILLGENSQGPLGLKGVPVKDISLPLPAVSANASASLQ